MKHRNRIIAAIVVVGVGCLVSGAGLGVVLAQNSGATRIVPVFSQDLAGEDEKQVTVVRVEYGPGRGSPPHEHPGHTFVYVLEGQIASKVDDGPTTVYKPGEMFYESPHAAHRISRNASKEEPAKALAFMIHTKGDTLTTPIHEHHPHD